MNNTNIGINNSLLKKFTDSILLPRKCFLFVVMLRARDARPYIVGADITRPHNCMMSSHTVLYVCCRGGYHPPTQIIEKYAFIM